MSTHYNCCRYPVINIEKPGYDQSTYWGRLKHYVLLTNPFNLCASDRKLHNAKCIVQKYRCNEPMSSCLDESQLRRAKYLRDSAYYVDRDETMPCITRPAALIPMSALVTTALMTFYQGYVACAAWQWITQSYSTLFNYKNKTPTTKISECQLEASYGLATIAAIGSALALNRYLMCAMPLIRRFIPFAGVAAGTIVGIPLLRSQDLKDGIPVYDHCDRRLGLSKVAAHKTVYQSILQRLAMFAPPMLLTPYVMNHLERRGDLCRYPWARLPAQFGLLAMCFMFSVPMGLALFRQREEMRFCDLEPALKCPIKRKLGSHTPYMVFYNRGL